MQWFKRSALAAALLFLIPLSGYSASADGTFTITIQGPEVEDTNTRPARNTNRQNQRQQQTQPAASNQNHNQQRQQSAQNTPQSSQQTAVNQSQSAPATPTVANGTNYRVSAGETIWSVAHRLVPVDKKVNEFQIIASIYRNNPNAFVDHNVHSLVRGANLLIPPVSEIALEDSNVGSALLKNGSYTLQPLKTNRNSSTGRGRRKTASCTGLHIAAEYPVEKNPFIQKTRSTRQRGERSDPPPEFISRKSVS